jgi:hypothetical protein
MTHAWQGQVRNVSSVLSNYLAGIKSPNLDRPSLIKRKPAETDQKLDQ